MKKSSTPMTFLDFRWSNGQMKKSCGSTRFWTWSRVGGRLFSCVIVYDVL